MLELGIYEQVINKYINKQLTVDNSKLIRALPIDDEEASKVLSKYIAIVIEKGLANIKDNGGDIHNQVDLCNKLVDTLVTVTGEKSLEELSVDKRAELLMALLEKKNTIQALNEKAEIIRPITSIAQSTLFTGAIREPSMFTELKNEILSCNRIDMLVSFIKWSGLRLIIDELKQFTQRGTLRIITTSYMGATDVKAVEALRELPNTEIKISYDTKRTRLHAKTYVFYRNTGYTTAYVGSSNLSNAAISSGLEWNVKVTTSDLPETIAKIDATFESYWNSHEFITYSETEKPRLESAIRAERTSASDNVSFNFDITPYPYQMEILDKLEAERKVRGHFRNLVVAATGTGKTVISAFDFKRFCIDNKGKSFRLLFVAHREEILKQSLYCFRTVLKDSNFGELFVGSYQPESIDNLFISVQTFNSREFDKFTTPDFYDFIIIDDGVHV
jgi:HKD family nuclease